LSQHRTATLDRHDAHLHHLYRLKEIRELIDDLRVREVTILSLNPLLFRCDRCGGEWEPYVQPADDPLIPACSRLPLTGWKCPSGC
jgi:hypothetical protein